MPLKCIKEDREVYSFELSDDSWDELRNASAKKALKMSCCGAGVVLRTSKLGTRHFAHTRREHCETTTETAEHLLAKLSIVNGIRQTSWLALPEQFGRNPAGEEWRADVLAKKGKANVAFEVQWSRQTEEETIRRQNRYAEAGVRGLWLFRQNDFPTGKKVPSFKLLFDENSKSFSVLIPSSRYSAYLAKHNSIHSSAWSQAIPLESFIKGALNGKLRFAPALGMKMPVVVEATEIECWRCKKETQIVMGMRFAASRVLPKCQDIFVEIYDIAENIPNGDQEVMSILSPEILKSKGIGAVKQRWSKTQGRAYLSNGCVHCDALQGRFFEMGLGYDSYPSFETEAEFKSEWAQYLEDINDDFNVWWFDES